VAPYQDQNVGNVVRGPAPAFQSPSPSPTPGGPRTTSWIAIVNVVVGHLLAIGLAVAGALLLHKSRAHLGNVSAKVVDTKCDADDDGRSVCRTTLTFTDLNGKEHRNTISLTKEHAEGSTVHIHYDPKNPKDISIKPSPHTLGWACIGAAAGVFVIVWIWFFLTR
jgi:hypothetical protein